ncbi:Hint domain-containing protein [Acetobacter sp.]|uniref:Hint domain-containing protein n=1 Tax=Acetobacter sp. TaxID=440 RepID=UPI0025BF4DAB|nr:Hint domain-containing protein [Acetobacter sp.]MCH4091697.1 Hint domain-containing protein [Acetobacter sp.]MCI1300446.1 Hint domain-containing protein [Acetobacter sp.]MCI1316735.1 Hint domain-containing protein [Acetobacter sp.]
MVGDFLNLGPSIESGSHYVQKNLTDIVPKTGDYYEITACFLAGTMISTVDGELPVEDVQEGALLRAYSGEGAPAAPVRVVWVGKSHAVVRSSDHDDVAGYPVRVLQNAIAEGVPAQDMLVTAEHCLFQEGAFVPVRMLVNGTSIFYDKSILSYDYYHIETEEHAIIEANGTLTESYLDTGNRHSFRQIAGMSRIGGTGLLWERDAAAPLKTDMAFVEPIFRRIEARAEACGYLPRQKQVSLTQDPGLHLVTDNGHVIRESRQVDGYTTFRLPAGVKSVRIVSRVSRPCDVVGPFLDDRRLMGVAVVQIKLFDDGKPHVLSSYRQQEILSGWCSVDAGETRWTSGDALLPLEGRVSGVFTQLAIQIVAGGPYAVHDTVDMADVLNA